MGVPQVWCDERMATCSVLPVAASIHPADAVAQSIAALQPALDRTGGRLVASVDDADPSVAFAVLVVTGGTERLVLDAFTERSRHVPGEPVLLITHPEQNSLPAALEALARLQRDGHRGRIVGVAPAAADTAPLAEAVHDLAAWHALHRSRIGVLGTPSDWLVASVPNGDAVQRRWGTTLVEMDLADALGQYARSTDDSLAVPVTVGARHVHEPSSDDIAAAARFAPVLRDCVTAAGLDAVTVRCFDLVTEAGTSGCLALSALNDDGVIAGCEGDVASAFGLLWVQVLTGRLGWMANPSAADPATGVIELAHCTVPRSLVTDYELHSHFESGLGVGIAGTLPPGPVTLVRLGGPELDRLWCVDATALPTEPRPGRCRTQLDVRAPAGAVAEMLEHPLGNHVIVVAGHHAEHLTRWWRSMVADAG